MNHFALLFRAPCLRKSLHDILRSPWEGAMSLSKFALLFGLVRPFVFAQQDNASILGTVTDSSGAVVPNDSVEIRNAGPNQALKLLTDSNGNFFAPVMPVGVYRISVTAAGFKVEVLDSLTLG